MPKKPVAWIEARGKHKWTHEPIIIKVKPSKKGLVDEEGLAIACTEWSEGRWSSPCYQQAVERIEIPNSVGGLPGRVVFLCAAHRAGFRRKQQNEERRRREMEEREAAFRAERGRASVIISRLCALGVDLQEHHVRIEGATVTLPETALLRLLDRLEAHP